MSHKFSKNTYRWLITILYGAELVFVLFAVVECPLCSTTIVLILVSLLPLGILYNMWLPQRAGRRHLPDDTKTIEHDES